MDQLMGLIIYIHFLRIIKFEILQTGIFFKSSSTKVQTNLIHIFYTMETIIIVYSRFIFLIMNSVQAMNKVQQNYYGIRNIKFIGTAKNNKIANKPPVSGKPLTKKKKVVVSKQKKRILAHSEEDQPKLVFFNEYKLVAKQKKQSDFFKKKSILSEQSSSRSLFTRKVSYVRLRPFRQSKLNQSLRKKGFNLTKHLSKSLGKLQSAPIILNENGTSYQKQSGLITDNSLSTRPASVSAKNCFSIIRNINNNKELNCSGIQEPKKEIPNKKFENPCLPSPLEAKIMIDDVNKQIPEQPESNIYSGSNYSSKAGSQESKSSKFRSIILLPIESRKKDRTIISSNFDSANSYNSELEGYIIVQSCLNRINLLAEYSQEIIQKYEDISDWDQLVFLVYKKFYLERKKLVRALLADNIKYFQDFLLKPKDKRKLESFIRHYQCQKLIQELVFENLTIEQSLRNLYNLIIQKSGDYINLLQFDNFSMRIFKLLLEQIQILKQIYQMDKEEVEKRLKNILFCSDALANIDKLEFRLRLHTLVQQINKIKMPTMGTLFTKVSLFFQTEILT